MGVSMQQRSSVRTGFINTVSLSRVESVDRLSVRKSMKLNRGANSCDLMGTMMMRLLSCRWMYCALGVAAFFWCGRSSHAGVYSLEVIVDSLPFGGPGNTTFNGFNGFGNPSINNDGDVAFWATASGTGKGIYKYSATTNDVSTVVPYSTLQATDIIGLAHVEMNNAGNVVHAGKRTDLYSLGGLGIQIPIETHFIYVNDTMLVRTNNNIYAGTPIDGLLLSSVSSASINDSDVIAFAATGGFGSGVFTQFDKLAATGDIIDGHVINSVSLDVVPSIDNQPGSVLAEPVAHAVGRHYRWSRA